MATHWQYRCLASLNVEAGTDWGQHFLFIYDYLLFPGSLFPSHNATVVVPEFARLEEKELNIAGGRRNLRFLWQT